ncbi:MAG TPA: M90 family metallopeptidase [Acidimicrobiia bacterium]|nr:M90 family metallopeptidase [Acidimicrobiia bacterium]
MATQRAGNEGPDPAWEDVAIRILARWDHLNADESARLLEQARVLDRTRSWEGLNGLSVSASMRALIACQACLLTVNIGLVVLRDVTSILVGRGSVTKKTRHTLGGLVVSEAHAGVIGETLLHGPLRLSWDQVEADGQADSGTSVVLHEFAHKIDMADGMTDGNPPMVGRRRSMEWDRISQEVLEDLRSGEPSAPLRDYAATNRSELFAVATEAFFLRPLELRSRFDSLYQAMLVFYGQDPACRPPPRGSEESALNPRRST